MKSEGRSPALTNTCRNKERIAFSFLPVLLTGILVIPALLLPPEGAVRSGDSVFLVFCWVLLFGIAGTVRPILRRCGESSAEQKNSCRFSPADLFLLLFIGWAALSWSALSTTGSGNRLAGANGFWTFALMPIFYMMIRMIPEQFRSLSEKLFLAILLGTAFCETGLSLYSYYVTAPAVREQFREDPESLLRENGMQIEKGTPEYLLFEKRVLDSTEPIGTYGMTNTLAGFLVPITLLLAALFLSALLKKIPDSFGIPTLFWLLFFGGGFGFTLLLTKSRSGYLALFAGLLVTAALILFSPRKQESRKPETKKQNIRKFLFLSLSITVLFILLLTAAFQTGLIDAEVFSEAKKSLGYRLDYWHSSAQMIADHPILGVGPGNFQTSYTKYILPRASETVADPHNFAFELAALFGLPALCLFLLFLAGLIRRGTEEKTLSGNSRPPYITIFLVFSAGYFFYILLNLQTSAPTEPGLLLGFAPIFAAASIPTALLASKLQQLPSAILLTAAGAGLLNLCAAGGIGFPAAAFPIWGLAALVRNRRCLISKKSVPSGKLRPKDAVSAFLSLLVLVLFLRTDLLPNLTEKKTLRLIPELRTSEAEALLNNAVSGTGRESIPLRSALCSIAINKAACSSENLEEWKEAKIALLKTAPGSASIRTDLGNQEYAIYKKGNNPVFLNAAIESYTAAVNLFPTDASAHARLALVLYAAGKKADAEKEKAEALRLDAGTEHEDRKIPVQLKMELTAFR